MSAPPPAAAGGAGGGSDLRAGGPDDPVEFGPYWLLGLIARGGMAEVFRARFKEDRSRLYAIKCMRPQLAKERRFVEMFEREAEVAKLLQEPTRHSTIVEFIESGQVDGKWFITMEYVGGKDLTQILRKCQEQNQRIPVPHACYITAMIAEGLHHAHTRTDHDGAPLSIVNRDVSPSNVRISYDGDVKLLDFGIVQGRVLKPPSEIGILKGKFSYMSPEQIRGMPLDARSDIFSTGIILHEMLTTEKLFRSDTEFALMEKVRKAEVPPPSKFNRRVPEALDRIALKALARDLGDRYQSAEELAIDLRELLKGYGFNPEEIREQVRSLFRSDFNKETAEVAACLKAPVVAPRAAPPPLPMDDANTAQVTMPPEKPEPAAEPAPGPGRASLWDKLRSKLRKG